LQMKNRQLTFLNKVLNEKKKQHFISFLTRG
jgi:hypothetical protein